MPKIQTKDAVVLRRAWGGKPCSHPSLAKEYYLGTDTGDFVCVQCGESFSPKEGAEIEASRQAK